MNGLTRSAVAALCAAAAAAACGKSDSPTGPTAKNVAGTYTYAFTNLGNGNGVVCSGTANMPITQSGATFSGTYSGTQSCSYPGGSETGPAAGTVINGRVVGDSVFFDMDNSSWHNFGVIQGTGMSGVVNASGVINGLPVMLAGPFTCVKQ